MGPTPRSAASETTSRLVDVPMVVDMPPIRIAQFTGMRVCAAGTPARVASRSRIGSVSTSTGVSLTNMLSAMQTSSENNMPSERLKFHSRPRARAAGSSAPVMTRPRPRIIRQQIAISASWLNPPNAISSPDSRPGGSSGNK